MDSSRLPIELRQIIGGYLSATDLVNLSKVNKAAYRHLAEDSPDIYDWLSLDSLTKSKDQDETGLMWQTD